jgi:hypothetical protein
MSLLFYPAVQLLGEGRQVKEEVLCWLKNRRLPINFRARGTELEFVIMVIAVSCVKLLSAHNSTQHTSRKHKV